MTCHRMLPLLAVPILALLFLGAAARTQSARAQTAIDDDLAVVMLAEQDVPGYRLSGDGGPAAHEGATNQQRTRLFVADGSTPDTYALLSEIITVPTAYASCLPYLPGNIAGGNVLGLLNDDKPNFTVLDAPAAGDVATAAAWSQLDTGTNIWLTVVEAVFMRGQVTVYLIMRTHAATIDSARLNAYAQRQDARLLAAIAAGTPVGLQAAAAVPTAPIGRPSLCG